MQEKGSLAKLSTGSSLKLQLSQLELDDMLYPWLSGNRLDEIWALLQALNVSQWRHLHELRRICEKKCMFHVKRYHIDLCSRIRLKQISHFIWSITRESWIDNRRQKKLHSTWVIFFESPCMLQQKSVLELYFLTENTVTYTERCASAK